MSTGKFSKEEKTPQDIEIQIMGCETNQLHNKAGSSELLLPVLFNM